jgi:hypothetical protein
MTIIGLTSSNETEHGLLLNYVLSLFKPIKNITGYVVNKSNTPEVIQKIKEASLAVLFLSTSKEYSIDLLNGLEHLKTPLMIVKSHSNLKSLLGKDFNVWGEFYLEDVTFNSNNEIKHTGKRLELIRLVNKIMRENLKVKPDDKFSCGITRPPFYVGDSIGY